MADVLLSSIVQPAKSTSQIFGLDPQAAFASAPGIAAKNLSGALTASVLKEIVNVSGAGYIDYLALQRVDATSRITRLRVTIDGAIVVDLTSTAVSSGSCFQFAVGYAGSLGPAIPFAQSFSVDISSSLTETNKLALYLRYRI